MDAIKLTFEGKSYELTYTRETVKQMENTGFDIQMLAHQPTVQGDKMFAGAFLAKCKGVKRKVIDDIWNHMDIESKNNVLAALADIYGDAMNSLADDGKKVTWEIAGPTISSKVKEHGARFLKN